MLIKKIRNTEASAPNIPKTLNMQNTTNNSMFVPTASPMKATTENIKSLTSSFKY